MDNRVKLLDCSLRESPTNHIGEKNIQILFDKLSESGIDIIECAFLTNPQYALYEKGGTHVNNIEQANALISNKRPGIIYSVCMNGGEYDLSKLSAADENGIDAIRYVLMEGKIDEEILDMELIIRKGYKLFVQHRNIISYDEEEISKIVEIINMVGAFAYSIVDTHGSMYAQDVKRIVSFIGDYLNDDIWLGFHGHNNHMLANSNAELFLNLTRSRKAVFVDGTIMGAGIGAGNANVELLANYCNKWEGMNYNVDCIYDAIDIVVPDIRKRCEWGYSIPTLITAEYNTVFTHGKHLKHILSNNSSRNINKLIKNMPDEYRIMNNMRCWESYRNDGIIKRMIRKNRNKKVFKQLFSIYGFIYRKILRR